MTKNNTKLFVGLLINAILQGCATASPGPVIPPADPAVRVSISEPVFVEYRDGVGVTCSTRAGSKLWLRPGDFAEVITQTLMQSDATIVPALESAKYGLSFRAGSGTIYYEVRDLDSGDPVWNDSVSWPSHVPNCTLCCNEKAQEHFSRFAQAFSAWDGTPAIIRPRDVLKIVEALPIGSRSMDELIAAFAVWAGGMPGAVNVRRVEYELLPPDNYVRHMAGRIAAGDSFDRVRGDLQSAGRGFGIIRLEAHADTIVYRMGNATRWVEAYETEYGNPPIMLSGRDDMIRAIETGVWQGLPTQFKIDPNMYEEECELRFDVATKTVTKNSCPAIDSSFDPDLKIEDAFVRRRTGLSTDETEAAQNQTVAWLRYVDGKLQSKVGPELNSQGRLIDISGSDLLRSARRDELPFLRK